MKSWKSAITTWVTKNKDNQRGAINGQYQQFNKSGAGQHQKGFQPHHFDSLQEF